VAVKRYCATRDVDALEIDISRCWRNRRTCRGTRGLSEMPMILFVA